mgnify:CR=1 FL=1
MNEAHLNLARMLIAGTTRYLCPVEEGCYIQREDRQGSVSVFKMAKYLYWNVVREQKN